MIARANDANDFALSGRIVASVATLEIIAGAVLMAVLPRWGLLVSLVWLAMGIGTIVALCAVDMPRRLRTVLITGLMALFVLTGARLDLLGTIGEDVAAHEASDDRTAPIVAQTVASTELAPRAEVPILPGDTPQRWADDIEALASQVSDASGIRATVRSITVNRMVEPHRVAFDWSIVVGDARKSCGAITIAAADRQAALDQIAATLRLAVDRARAAGVPLCY